MKSIRVLFFFLCLMNGSQALADRFDNTAFTVYQHEPDEGKRITPYLQYQMDQAWDQDDLRRARLLNIRTENELLQLQREIRNKLLQAIGGLPEEKTPLNARIEDNIQMEGYRIEKLVYESIPRYHVSALVFSPDGPVKKRPAVLMACGHAPEAKGAYYHGIASSLARRGYVVLVWDPVGQGERSQFWNSQSERSRYNRVCGEHAILGNLAYLVGANLARWEIWDGIRAFDYLLSRSDVDSTRISITGTSGGGFQSSHIGALDPRINVVAPSCYISSLPMRMNNRIFEDPDSDPEQDLYRMVSDGIDHPGLCILIYPRPLVISAAVEDFFPIEGTRKTFREVTDIYSMFAKSGRIALTEGYHRHSFSLYNRKAAFAFLDRFNGMQIRNELDPADSLDAKALRCTESGQVLLEYGGRNLIDLIREYYLKHKDKIKLDLASLYYGEYYPGIDTWQVTEYSGGSARGKIEWEKVGSSKAGDTVIDRYLLHHSEWLSIPILHIHCPERESNSVLMWFNSEASKTSSDDWSEIEKYLKEGYQVVSFDFRALGENRMRYIVSSIDDSSLAQVPFEKQYTSNLSGVLANYVYNSLLIGRPFFLQMIEDAEIVSNFVRSKLGSKNILVTSKGEAYSLAYSIAEVLPYITLLRRNGENALKWSEIVNNMQETWPIWYILPGGAYIR